MRTVDGKDGCSRAWAGGLGSETRDGSGRPGERPRGQGEAERVAICRRWGAAAVPALPTPSRSSSPPVAVRACSVSAPGRTVRAAPTEGGSAQPGRRRVRLAPAQCRRCVRTGPSPRRRPGRSTRHDRRGGTGRRRSKAAVRSLRTAPRPDLGPRRGWVSRSGMSGSPRCSAGRALSPAIVSRTVFSSARSVRPSLMALRLRRGRGWSRPGAPRTGGPAASAVRAEMVGLAGARARGGSPIDGGLTSGA